MSKKAIDKQQQEILYTQLNLLGAKKVFVYFQGGGDDGQIEDVYYLDRNDDRHDIPKDMISWTEQVWGDNKPQEQQVTLQDALEDLCERALDNTGLDWYNNEGGQGNLVIDFTESPPKTELQVGINTMSTEDYRFSMDEEVEE